MMKIIDISCELLSADSYPGDPQPRLQQILRLDQGDPYNLTALYTGLHSATHVDAPAHFLEDGACVEALELDRFIGPCHVLEVIGPFTGRHVDRFLPWDCQRLLIKGGGSSYIMEAAAQELARLGVRLVGIDSPSVGTQENPHASHAPLLAAGIPILEGLHLEQVTAGEYFLFAPPLKIAGAEAAPARAVLISDYLFWNR